MQVCTHGICCLFCREVDTEYMQHIACIMFEYDAIDLFDPPRLHKTVCVPSRVSGLQAADLQILVEGRQRVGARTTLETPCAA